MDGMGMVIIINLISGAVGLQCSVVTIIVIVAHTPVVHKCRRGKSLLSNFHLGQENGFQKFLWLFRHYRGSTFPWCHWSPTCTPRIMSNAGDIYQPLNQLPGKVRTTVKVGRIGKDDNCDINWFGTNWRQQWGLRVIKLWSGLIGICEAIVFIVINRF